MISDEFETFGDNHFWRGETKTKIFVQKTIHFIKNPEYSFKLNIHFLKIQNIHWKQIFFFLKSRTFIQKIHFLEEAYQPGLWTGGFVARLDYYLGHEKDCQEVLASVPTGA